MKSLKLNNFIKRPFFSRARILQNLLLIGISVAIWRVFYPGLMTSDSIDQYGQALSGSIRDWHPPLMAIVLWLFFKLGLGISGLILLQCLGAVFGLRSAISKLAIFFSNKLILESQARLYGTILTIIFLLPFLSPYIFITIIFWKDAWLTIGLLWLVSYVLWINLNSESFSYRVFLTHFTLLSLGWSLTVLIRHNAFVMLPVICLLLATIYNQKVRRYGFILAIIPLVFSFCLNPLVKYAFNVQPTAINNLIISNDLASMLDYYPELADEYPATAARHNYAPLWRETEDKETVEAHNKAVRAEYLVALKNHPEKLVSVRLRLFGMMLSPKVLGTQKMGYDVIEENPYGLQINNDYKNSRNYLTDLSWNLGHRWYLIWLSGWHMVWFIINSILALIYSIKIFLKRKVEYKIIFLLYLIPFSYYFSYILAATSPDYRFMFPATLIMQVLTITQLLALIQKYRKQT